MNTTHHDTTTPTRLIVRVLQEVVREHHATYSDLAEALKARCARLRIPYDAASVSAAIDQLERGGRRPIVVLATRALTAVDLPGINHSASIMPGMAAWSARDAAEMLRELFAKGA